MAEMKSVIVKALQRSHDLPIEDQAEMVIRYMEIAQDLAGPVAQTYMGMQVKVDPTMPKNKIAFETSTGRTEVEFNEPAPLPSRLASKPTEVSSLLRQYRTVDEIRSYMETNAPSTLEVAINGGAAPLMLTRRVEAHEPMDMVKLIYIPQGASTGPAAIFCTTDEKIGLGERLQEIRDAVRAQYSGVPRQVTAKPARVTQEGVNMVGGEAGDHEDISSNARSIFASRSSDELAEMKR